MTGHRRENHGDGFEKICKALKTIAIQKPELLIVYPVHLNPKVKVDCEWAAWANGTAVRELDYHDTFLAADYSHPGDNIPAILAVAQQKGCNGMDLSLIHI